jgi:hypothetical protein
MPALASNANLNPTAAAPTAVPAPASGLQAVVFADDGGSPTVNISATDPVMVGDTGSGGLAGNVPAPPAGSAAAGKFLKADGTFAVPAGSVQIGFLTLTPSASGPFQVAHSYGASLLGFAILMTNLSTIVAQTTPFDSSNIYLTAADASARGIALLFY